MLIYDDVFFCYWWSSVVIAASPPKSFVLFDSNGINPSFFHTLLCRPNQLISFVVTYPSKTFPLYGARYVRNKWCIRLQISRQKCCDSVGAYTVRQVQKPIKDTKRQQHIFAISRFSLMSGPLPIYSPFMCLIIQSFKVGAICRVALRNWDEY